ncbi:MAG: ROK family protein [Candidatus Pacearchaeota archaeon]|jgi:glucokinase
MAGSKVIAVDLGGTNLRVSLVNNGKVIKYVKKSTPKDQESLIKELDDSISQLISQDIMGIGIGSPGPLDSKKGIIINPPNLPFRNFNLKKHLENKFKKKVIVENDVHCVALAEAKLGCKKKNFIVLAFGTGIGGGIVVENKLFVGNGYGGEMGHIVLDNNKFFEILWQEAKKNIEKKFGKDILVKDLLKMKNPDAKKLLEEITGFIGRGIASLINVFDPEIVILNGGMKEAGEPLLKLIKEQTKRYITLPRETKITWSDLEHPGTLGASLLITNPMKKLFLD